MHIDDPTPTAPPANRRPSRWPFAFAVVLTTMLALGLITLYLAPVWAARWRQADDQAAADATYLRRQAELKAESEDADRRLESLDRRVQFVSLGFREIARKVAPVVVHIGNELEAQEPLGGKTFYDLEKNRHYVERAEGSGILMRPGYVLTNRHVVDRAQRLRVTFASGRWLLATPDRIATDRPTDLAVIRLPDQPGSNFATDYAVSAEFADSDKDVQVGDWVLAAGSPFGLRQTFTKGIISAKGRVDIPVLDYVELLQTDAAINPGNSGGPLFDLHGRVAGINVAIASENGHNEGIGFAIPSNTARDIFQQLVERGEVVRGFLGILMQEVPDGLEDRLGVKETGAVIVSAVEPRSPADHAGLRKGDLLVRYNGDPVGKANPLNRLRRRIAGTPPETTIDIEVLRHGQAQIIPVTLSKRPPKL